jgi:hypothetical protein
MNAPKITVSGHHGIGSLVVKCANKASNGAAMMNVLM